MTSITSDATQASSTTSPVLSIRGLAKRFGGLAAVDGVDLDVMPGERRAVIGPNGAGKTTLFNLITGYFKPDAGTVELSGTDVTGWPTHRIAREGLGRAFQITSIFPALSVFENVQLGRFARKGETAQVYGRAKGRHHAEVMEILDSVGLGDLPAAHAGQLSHGDQRALELAISLALEPKLLLLDEPTAGMAPAETERTMTLVRRIALERNLTLLFCEHDMDVVFGTADRVLVMHQGRPLADGTPEEIRAHPEVRRVYLGDDDA
ncbi:ABC transporter ATP-binding protein [soil metagenome]